MSGLRDPGHRLLAGWFQPTAVRTGGQSESRPLPVPDEDFLMPESQLPVPDAESPLPDWTAFISEVFGDGAGEAVYDVLDGMAADLSQPGYDYSYVLENPLSLVPSEDNGLKNYAKVINEALEASVKIQDGAILQDARDGWGNPRAHKVANGSNNFVVITPDRVYRVNRYDLDDYSTGDETVFIVPFYNALMWYFIERSGQGEFPNFISRVYRVYKETNLARAPLTLKALNDNIDALNARSSDQVPGFDENAGICQELENAGTDMYNYIKHGHHPDTASIVNQALLIMYYLYDQQRVIHGDAKTDNMTITEGEPCRFQNPINPAQTFEFNDTIKFIDFDLSCVHQLEQRNPKGTFDGGWGAIVCNSIAQDVLLFCYTLDEIMSAAPAFPSDENSAGEKWKMVAYKIHTEFVDLYAELAAIRNPGMRNMLGLSHGPLREYEMKSNFQLNFLRNCFSSEMKEAIEGLDPRYASPHEKREILEFLLAAEEFFLPQNLSVFLGLW